MAPSHSSQAVPGIAVRWGLRLIPLAGIAIAVLTLPWLMGSSGTPDPAGAAREMASVLVHTQAAFFERDRCSS